MQPLLDTWVWFVAFINHNFTSLMTLVTDFPIRSVIISIIILTILRWVNRRLRERRLRKGKRVGIYLDPLVTNFLLRPIVSLIAGLAISFGIYQFDMVTGSAIFPLWAAWLLGLLLALLFARNEETPKDKDEKHLVVPKAYVAILTFFGLRLNIYLTEGDHYWLAQRFGFDRSTDPLPNSDPETYPKEAEGFVFIGDRPLEIFFRKESKDKSLILQNIASDFSEVFTKLTIVVRTGWPLRWANSDDPILTAAERTRSALRTVVSFFSGVDNAALKAVYSKLLRGHVLFAAFINKPVGIHPRGAVIQNQSGQPIFEIANPDVRGDLKNKKKALSRELQKEYLVDSEMFDAIPRDREGMPIIQRRRVDEHILTVMTEIGAVFVSASVSDITLSEEVTRQANIAAGESFQRTGQVLSAHTIAQTRQIIAENAGQPGSELATMAALAKDGHAKIIYVPGDDALTRAIVAGASQIKDDRNDS